MNITFEIIEVDEELNHAEVKYIIDGTEYFTRFVSCALDEEGEVDMPATLINCEQIANALPAKITSRAIVLLPMPQEE